MGNHALLSLSSSRRWLKCIPSAVLETEFENRSSNADEEGTAAHALCEYKEYHLHEWNGWKHWAGSGTAGRCGYRDKQVVQEFKCGIFLSFWHIIKRFPKYD